MLFEIQRGVIYFVSSSLHPISSFPIYRSHFYHFLASRISLLSL